MINIVSERSGQIVIVPANLRDLYWILAPRPTPAKIESVSVIFGADGPVFRCRTIPYGQIVYVDQGQIFESDKNALMACLDQITRHVQEQKQTLPG